MSADVPLTPEILLSLGFSGEHDGWWSNDRLPGDNHTLIPNGGRRTGDVASYNLGGYGSISTVGDLFAMIYRFGVERGRKDAGDEMRRLMGLDEGKRPS